MSEQRITDERLRIACHPQELQIAPRWSNALIDCGELALDLRDCRARLAEVKRERDEWKDALENGVRPSVEDLANALAAEQARTKALREALEEIAGYGCFRVESTAGDAQDAYDHLAACVNRACAALASPSPQDALVDVIDACMRAFIAKAVAAAQASSPRPYGERDCLTEYGHGRAESADRAVDEIRAIDAAAIVASVLKEVGQ